MVQDILIFCSIIILHIGLQLLLLKEFQKQIESGLVQLKVGWVAAFVPAAAILFLGQYYYGNGFLTGKPWLEILGGFAVIPYLFMGKARTPIAFTRFIRLIAMVVSICIVFITNSYAHNFTNELLTQHAGSLAFVGILIIHLVKIRMFQAIYPFTRKEVMFLLGCVVINIFITEMVGFVLKPILLVNFILVVFFEWRLIPREGDPLENIRPHK